MPMQRAREGEPLQRVRELEPLSPELKRMIEQITATVNERRSAEATRRPLDRCYQWRDRHGQFYRLSENYIADEACVRLGTHLSSIRLNQEEAAQLIPLLTHFVATGELP